MRSPRINVVSIAAAALVAAAALTACSSSEPAAKATAATSAPTVPKGFEAPDGVTLAAGGETIAVGKPATVVYQVGDSAASAVTVTVTAVTPGSIDDFKFFSLDDATKKSSPFYVSASVRNDGPAGLGGGSLPLFALDSSSTNIPANDIVGTFKPCPTPTLPASFLPGSTAELCLVYLIPEGRTLTSINLQTGATKDAISWKP